MGTYLQWRASFDKGEVRRLTYVCGDQWDLVYEVLDGIRARLAVADGDLVNFGAAMVSPADVWDAANQLPLTPDATRLVLVHQAEALSDWSPLAAWLAGARELAGIHLLFISGEPEPPTVRGKPAPHIALMQAKPRWARIVHCRALKEEDAIGWVRRQVPLDQDVAHHLMTRVNGDLAAAAQVCRKLALFDNRASRSTVDALCVESPHEFVDELIAGHKRRALMVVAAMTDRDHAPAINLLIRRVDLLGALWRASRAGQSAREITGHPPFLVHRFLPHAKHYDPQRCVYARRVLAVVDDAHRNGARDGVMEALVALW